MSEDENPLGGRVTLGVVGVVVLALGGAGVAYAVTYPSAAGLATYALSGAFAVVGLTALVAAIVNPDSLDIGTRTTPSEAELRERQTEDPTDDH